MKFSPKIINEYLGRSKSVDFDDIPFMDKISIEINVRQFNPWPKNGLIPLGIQSVKYEVLNEIGVENWAPTNHN